jgi:hypothetical protein
MQNWSCKFTKFNDLSKFIGRRNGNHNWSSPLRFHHFEYTTAGVQRSPPLDKTVQSLPMWDAKSIPSSRTVYSLFNKITRCSEILGFREP